jgi:hypothetical protein
MDSMTTKNISSELRNKHVSNSKEEDMFISLLLRQVLYGHQGGIREIPTKKGVVSGKDIAKLFQALLQSKNHYLLQDDFLISRLQHYYEAVRQAEFCYEDEFVQELTQVMEKIWSGQCEVV